MNLKEKCSLEKHQENNAIKYCPECRIYICNKCDNHHTSLFINHHPFDLNSDNEIFTGFCKEKEHYILKYFCKLIINYVVLLVLLN